MKCPQCDKASEVIDTRLRGQAVRRKRRCLNNHEFVTLEINAAIIQQMRGLVEVAKNVRL